MTRRRKHKYQIGQVVQILNSPYVYEPIRGRLCYITLQLNHTYHINEPEYEVIIQGQPDLPCRIFQKELKAI